MEITNSSQQRRGTKKSRHCFCVVAGRTLLHSLSVCAFRAIAPSGWHSPSFVSVKADSMSRKNEYSSEQLQESSLEESIVTDFVSLRRHCCNLCVSCNCAITTALISLCRWCSRRWNASKWKTINPKSLSLPIPGTRKILATRNPVVSLPPPAM